MFERYTHNIDPDDADFQAFIKAYVSTRDPRDPSQIPYLELYKFIIEGIRDYLGQAQEPKHRSGK